MSKMKDATEVNLAVPAKWVNRLKSPFWGLLAALGPAAILFLSFAVADRIPEKFASEGNTLSAWIYACVLLLSLFSVTLSVGITAFVCGGIHRKRKEQRKESQPNIGQVSSESALSDEPSM